MDKIKLKAITTEPSYDGKAWEGAKIHVLMEVEGAEKTLDGTLRIGDHLLFLSQVYGYEDLERLIMKRVEYCLDNVQKEFDVDPKDINTIYEIVRLKMQRFVHKSAIHSSYLWNAITGEIREDEE
jgi:hypothetical protein